MIFSSIEVMGMTRIFSLKLGVPPAQVHNHSDHEWLNLPKVGLSFALSKCLEIMNTGSSLGRRGEHALTMTRVIELTLARPANPTRGLRRPSRSADSHHKKSLHGQSNATLEESQTLTAGFS
jgi:hypothetical protein